MSYLKAKESNDADSLCQYNEIILDESMVKAFVGRKTNVSEEAIDKYLLLKLNIPIVSTVRTSNITTFHS